MAYDERLLGGNEHKKAPYRALQPFGQVPAYEEDGLALFESGAIVLHIAERSTALMPASDPGRAQTKSWMFAALSSVEPPILALRAVGDSPGPARDRAAALVDERLRSLAAALEGRPHLLGAFSAADLLMTTVLREVESLASHPALEAYRDRCMTRPAFRKALADQLRPFAANAPAPA
ncbi:MAG TPA: glutathione S-transferase family protein [Caldimonas sp.]|nr:glutathione S-transferase family protein [Caldimonas sp.]